MPTYDWQTLMAQAAQYIRQVWPPGEYEVEVGKTGVKKTNAGDKDMILVYYRALSGPMMGKGTVLNRMTLSPESEQAMGIFFREMDAMGITSEFFGPGTSVEDIANALVGRRCRVQIVVTQWNGEDRNEVTAIRKPLPTGAVAPPQPGIPVPAPTSTNGVPHVPQAPAQAPVATAPVTPPSEPVPPAPAPPAAPQPTEPPAPPAPPTPQPPQEPAPEPQPQPQLPVNSNGPALPF